MNEVHDVQGLLCRMLGVDTSSHTVAGVDLRIRGGEVPTLTVTHNLFKSGQVQEVVRNFRLEPLDKPDLDLDAMVEDAQTRLRDRVNANFRRYRDSFAESCAERDHYLLAECDNWRSARSNRLYREHCDRLRKLCETSRTFSLNLTGIR